MENALKPLRCLRTLANTENVRVAEFEIAPETEGETHYHSAVHEHCICLQGQLKVIIDGHPAYSLRPGDRLEIPAGVRHQASNISTGPCQYMVIQCGVGFDYIAELATP